ncbi:MAG: GIY-YIG nuclease family protein [bacterium]|nr:GIY-YIG nuclease family protein [Candidatus Limimorpha caballi]
MSNNEIGYVYILTNPSFREDWVKIGKSSRPVDVRSKELDNTAVPLPFEIYATLKTSKYAIVEKQIHKQIDRLTDLRIRQNREFFNIAPDVALDIMRDIADLLDDAEIAVYVNGKPMISKDKDEDKKIKDEVETKKHLASKPSFKFPMIGLKVGDVVTFSPTGVEVRVATDNKVEYEGRLWSLSAFTATFMPIEKQNTSGAYQGPKYFTYKGKTLNDLRNENEGMTAE